MTERKDADVRPVADDPATDDAAAPWSGPTSRATTPATTPVTTTPGTVTRDVPTDRRPLAVLVAAMRAEGLSPRCTTRDDPDAGPCDAGRAAVADAARDMETEVRTVDWLIGEDPGDPYVGSWTVTWAEDHETTVTISHDSEVSAMDADGYQWNHAPEDGIHVVTMRHVRRIVGGAITTLTATIDGDRLGLPSDDADGRRPVHAARTVVGLMLSAMSLDQGSARQDGPTRGRTRRDTIVDDVRLPPVDDAPLLSTDDEDRRLAQIAGMAVLVEAERIDLAEGPSARSVTIRMLFPSALAPGSCTVHSETTMLSLDRAGMRLPGSPVNLDTMTVRNKEDGRASFVIASITLPEIVVCLEQQDPLSRLRLVALADRWRNRTEPRP